MSPWDVSFTVRLLPLQTVLFDETLSLRGLSLTPTMMMVFEL